MSEINLTNILIHCPKKSFDLRKANKCFICGHYLGIIKATERGEYVKGNEADDFQVLCGRPITRKLIKIVSD